MNNLVSVLMCVYNTNENVLKQAITSILKQTYEKLEFVIIDDHSNEETVKTLSFFQDERIKIFRNPVNLGLTKSLNIGLNKCTGRYVARMDSDDVAEPQRIEKQIKYMEKGFGFVGTLYSFMPYKPYKTFITEDIRKQRIRMLFGNAGIVHSTAFIDLDLMRKKGILYNEKYRKSQDYALWCEFLNNNIGFGVVPENLLKWRVSDNQISVKFKEEQTQCRSQIREEYVKRLIALSKKDMDIFVNRFDGDIYGAMCSVGELDQIFCNIINRNKNIDLIEEELCRYWFNQILFSLKNYHTVALIFSKMFIKILKPNIIKYIYKSYISELKIF